MALSILCAGILRGELADLSGTVTSQGRVSCVPRLGYLADILLPSRAAPRAHMDPARRRVAGHRPVVRAVVFLRHPSPSMRPLVLSLSKPPHSPRTRRVRACP